MHGADGALQLMFDSLAQTQQHRRQQRHQPVGSIEHIQAIDRRVAQQALEAEKQTPGKTVIDQRSEDEVAVGFELSPFGIGAVVADLPRRLPQDLGDQVHQSSAVLLDVEVDGLGAGGADVIPAQVNGGGQDRTRLLDPDEPQLGPIEPGNRGVRCAEINADSDHCSLFLGTNTHSIPAASAAWTPSGLSSKTTHSAGATFNRRAASRKGSGAGLARA